LFVASIGAWAADPALPKCPEGWNDLGPACVKPAAYSRGAGYSWKGGDGLNTQGQFARCEKASGKGNCDLEGTLVFPKCKPGFVVVKETMCSPVCPSGFTDQGSACAKPVKK
jgi:hypothetical protein